jgi:CIC family chloride channel protein
MTGDFSLTLPVMLAVAIAATISRALSYSTIYTEKLLRRGTDIDRTTPWRALADLKVADAMQPFRPPLTVPPPAPVPAAGGNGSAPDPDWAALAGPVTGRHDPQAVFVTESLAQTLRQLEAYGRDGLPVLSPDGQHAEGWVTSASVLRAIAGQISDSQHEAARRQTGAGPVHGGEETPPGEPPAPLAGYQLIELTLTPASPAAGAQLGSITWPPGTTPVAVLHDHIHRPPGPATTLHPGDRISLLTPAPASPHRPSSPPQ